MIRRWHGSGWSETEIEKYKNEPGTWMDVDRQILFDSESSQFQTRYFEIAPGGYSSFEEHEHEHCVMVLRGSGQVRLNDAWQEIQFRDVVHVGPHVPHQFKNDGDEPFGILCIVDRVRDRPTLLGTLPIQ